MTDAFLGEVRTFAGTFAPRGWALCNGQLLGVRQSTALFSLLGTSYGGDGVSTFALPDLRGRVPLHVGQSPGLSAYGHGDSGGVAAVTLGAGELPAHTHGGAVADVRSTDSPLAAPAPGGAYGQPSQGSTPTLPAGGGQPHDNMQPFLCLTFIIALEGIFPQRP